MERASSFMIISVITNFHIPATGLVYKTIFHYFLDPSGGTAKSHGPNCRVWWTQVSRWAARRKRQNTAPRRRRHACAKALLVPGKKKVGIRKEKSVYAMVHNMGAIRQPTGSDEIQHQVGGNTRARRPRLRQAKRK